MIETERVSMELTGGQYRNFDTNCYLGEEWSKNIFSLTFKSQGLFFLSSLSSNAGWGHCAVFLGKTLYSHSASLHPGVQMGTG